MKYPSVYARFYDTFYHKLRDSADSDFFLNEIKKTKGKVLEAGVGTGRLFTRALDLGADVYGLDISECMVDVLYKKLPEDQHHRISLQNIINFSYDFRFDLVIAPFRVMMHLTDKEDQLRAIGNVYRHLNAGGRFIFDVFVPDPDRLKEGITEETDFVGEYEPGHKLRRIVSATPDLVNQIMMVKFRLEWDERSGIRQELWEFPMRLYFRYELKHLIERSSFEKYQIKGDFHGTGLDKNSADFVVTCFKNPHLKR